MIDFPVGELDRFPVVNVKQLLFSHVEKLLSGDYSTDGPSVQVIDLRPKFSSQLADTPPVPPAEGE